MNVLIRYGFASVKIADLPGYRLIYRKNQYAAMPARFPVMPVRRSITIFSKKIYAG